MYTIRISEMLEGIMRVKRNTIIINGRVYDATTGKAIDHVVVPSAKPANEIGTIARKPVNVSTNSLKPARKISVQSDSLSSASPRPVATKIRVTSTASTAGRKPEHSKTLMRNIVKRPAKNGGRHAISAPTEQPAKNIAVKSLSSVSKNRHQVSTSTKSPQISRFASHQKITSPQIKKAHLPVVSAPNGKQTHHLYDIGNTPPAPRVTKNSKSTLKDVHKDLFQTALEGASSHKSTQIKRKKLVSRRQKIMRLGASAVTLLLLVAFYGYQNLPNLALKRASSKIGFNSSIPSYHPSGYRLSGPVEYSVGNFKLTYGSNAGSGSYTISAKNNGMDNDSLVGQFLSNKEFRKVSANGVASYIYNGTNITWVKNGVWYDLNSTAALSEDQLVNIASSL